MVRVHPCVAGCVCGGPWLIGIPVSAGDLAGGAGLNCLISTVDGSRRTPGVRQCAQRHDPRASLPASTSKALLQRFPGLTGRAWRVPVGSVRLTNTGRFASACKDARGPRARSLQSPSGVLGVCRMVASPWYRVPNTFQSPSGVLGVCRALGPTDWWRGKSGRFSPLPGF